jgi:NAD(P)-dependent dehydrogenase (short-subunit alcohol dehydrogenase family)
MKLQDKIAIITGGADGLGKAGALKFSGKRSHCNYLGHE